MTYRLEGNLEAGILIPLMELFTLYFAGYSQGLALPFLGTTEFIEHFHQRVRGLSHQGAAADLTRCFL